MKRSLPPYVYPKGKKGYLYFIKDGLIERMPDNPASPEFATRYARLRGGRFISPSKRNVKALIAQYMRSPEWARLKPNTKKSYMRSMRYLEEKIGHLDPSTLRRGHVKQMRDALSDTPTTANRRVGMLSVLMEYAIDLDWMTHNPARGVENLEGKRDKREPWPADKVADFRAAADTRTALIFELLIITAQRISDVLKMQWGQIEDDGIWITQRKTNAKLWVPFTPQLKEMLAKTPRRSLFIVTMENGQPPVYQTAWTWVMKVRREIGAERWDIHSLRHTAASELAALGLDDEHIMAITGHASKEMVRWYAGQAAQKARAKKVQALRNGTGPEQES